VVERCQTAGRGNRFTPMSVRHPAAGCCRSGGDRAVWHHTGHVFVMIACGQHLWRRLRLGGRMRRMSSKTGRTGPRILPKTVTAVFCLAAGCGCCATVPERHLAQLRLSARNGRARSRQSVAMWHQRSDYQIRTNRTAQVQPTVMLGRGKRCSAPGRTPLRQGWPQTIRAALRGPG